MTALYRGELEAARASLERAVRGYDPARDHARAMREYGGHPHPAALAYLGRTLLFLGYPDQALRRGEEAVSEARRWSGPLGMAQVLGMLTTIHQARRDLDDAWERSEIALAYATDKGIAHWIVQSTIARAWVRGVTEPAASLDASVADIRHAIDRFRATGTILGLSEYLALLAEVYAAGRRVPDALAAVDEARRHAEATGERYYAAEIERLRGELLLARGDGEDEAEAAFRRALLHARAQGARMSELRAATSCARLLQRRGAGDEARALLAPLYAWLSEGFEAPDVRAARAVLEAPAARPAP
jgi:predicted ATPase